MKKKLLRVLIAVLICLLIGLLSIMVTQTSIDAWYTTLKKPSFTPPGWTYLPISLLLYIMMGAAAGLVWSKGLYHKWVKTALYHFGFQLLLNAAWFIIFFGLRNPLFALLDIIALFILLLFTITRFRIVNNLATYLLIPYTIWVAFATILNFSIWRLN